MTSSNRRIDLRLNLNIPSTNINHNTNLNNQLSSIINEQQQLTRISNDLREQNFTSQLLLEEKKDVPFSAGLIRIITKPIHDCFNTMILTKSQLTIGRDNHCDLQITSIEISRRHAQIVYKDSKWYIINLNSTNGVYVNGLKIKYSTPLYDNYIVTFGPLAHSTFRYVFVDDYSNYLLLDKKSTCIPRSLVSISGNGNGNGNNDNDKKLSNDDIVQQSTQNNNDDKCIINKKDYVKNSIKELETRIKQLKSEIIKFKEFYDVKIKIKQQELNIINGKYDTFKKLLEKTEGIEINEQFKKVIANELLCSVCFEILHEPTVLECGHTFCFSCINAWKNHSKRHCPICRKKFLRMNKSIQFQSLLDIFLQHYLTDEELKERKQSIESRASDPAFSNELCPFSEQIREILEELDASFNGFVANILISPTSLRYNSEEIILNSDNDNSFDNEILDEIDDGENDDDDEDNQDDDDDNDQDDYDDDFEDDDNQEDEDDNIIDINDDDIEEVNLSDDDSHDPYIYVNTVDDDDDDDDDADEHDSVNAVNGSISSLTSSNVSDRNQIRRFFRIIESANESMASRINNNMDSTQQQQQNDMDVDESMMIIDNRDHQRFSHNQTTTLNRSNVRRLRRYNYYINRNNRVHRQNHHHGFGRRLNTMDNNNDNDVLQQQSRYRRQQRDSPYQNVIY